MAGAHLTRSQWTTTENWNPGAVIDKFRRGREVVRDKGVTTEGKRMMGSPISVTDWASGLQCMVPSPRGCQGFRACHSEVCGLGLELSEEAWRPCHLHLSRRRPETVASAQHVDPAKGHNRSRSVSKSSSMTTQVGARGRLCFCADD